MRERVTQTISEARIKARVAELAAQISCDYQGETLTFVSVLKGSVFFAVDLARQMSVPVMFDFMEVSSYGDDTKSSGIVRIVKDLSRPVTGKHVLLLEDIIDSGATLGHIRQHLLAQNPASLRIAAFLDKPGRRVNFDCAPDYAGFTIPNRFIVGYGLDYAQKYRNLPYIGEISFME